MSFKRALIISSVAMCLAGTSAWAQDDDEPTIRAIPDPAADLPEAVTREVPFPTQAAEIAAGRSAAGRSGERRAAGLATALAAPAGGPSDDGIPDGAGAGIETAQANAADTAQEALANAADAAAGSREDFGRSHAPESMPDPAPDLPGLPDLPDQAPDVLPDTPPGPDVPVTPGRP